jgi:ribosomal protein S6
MLYTITNYFSDDLPSSIFDEEKQKFIDFFVKDGHGVLKELIVNEKVPLAYKIKNKLSIRELIMIVDVEPKVINSYSSFVGRNDNVLR